MKKKKYKSAENKTNQDEVREHEALKKAFLGPMGLSRRGDVLAKLAVLSYFVSVFLFNCKRRSEHA